MSFIIWYKLEIDEPPSDGGGLLAAVKSLLGVGLPVKVSNDVLSGAAYVVDSDITVSLQSGAVASSFEIKITNLPTATTDLLKSKHQDGMKNNKPLQTRVFLGYFDNLPGFTLKEPTFEGVILSLKSDVNDSGVMETVIKGQELAGYKLRTMCNPRKAIQGDQGVDDILKSLLSGTGVALADGHGLTKKYTDFTPEGRTILDAIRIIAGNLVNKDVTGVPVVVRDKKLFMANAVGAGDPVVTLSEDTDFVKEDDDADAQEPKLDQSPCPEDTSGGGTPGSSKKPVRAPVRPGLALTVLGNPQPRPGQVVTLKHSGKADEKWRIEQVDQRFSTSNGYTTDLRLAKANPGDASSNPSGAHGVVQRFRDLTEASPKQPIDVGEVSDYQSGADKKHLATLNYGQDAAPGEVAPSVTVPINQSGSQLLNKPIASPFAFHKCGLIVPVYPKMRALLAHNQGATNDAVVAGFVWSEDPRLEPPRNQPGDYWLCLPTELTSGLPSGKGVNDLIDASGKRIIQAKGVQIFVGTDKLPEVGERPAVPSSVDGAVVIEHQKGATITITPDGAVQIKTDNQDISLTNGQVTVKLSGSSVEVS
jgi:hypothetical protein